MSFAASADPLSALQSLATISSQLSSFKPVPLDRVAPLRLTTPPPASNIAPHIKDYRAETIPAKRPCSPAIQPKFSAPTSQGSFTRTPNMKIPQSVSQISISHAGPESIQIYSPGSHPRSNSDTLPVPRQTRTPQQQQPQPQQQQSIEVGKRTKSSRACDECRRKKIRCDIDSGAVSCSPCQRLGTCCTFSRVQLKRGPTKRARSYSDGTQPYPTSGQLPGIDALLSWSTQMAGTNGVVPPAISRARNTQFNTVPERRQSFAGGFASMFDAPRSPAMNSFSSSLPPNSPLIQPDSPNIMLQSPLQYGSSIGSQSGSFGQPSPPISSHPHAMSPMPVSGNTLQANGSKTSLDQVYMPPVIDPVALAQYYAKWHPIFPILPDTPRELEVLVSNSGMSGVLLAAAISGNIRSIPSDPLVPGVSKVSQLMALLLVYLHTLEFAWLGAAVATVIAVSRENSEHGPRLLGVVAALDQLDSAVFGNPRLLTAPVEKPTDARLLRTFWGIGADVPSPGSPNDCNLKALQWLARPTASEARSELQKLAPLLQDTPLRQFIQAVLEGRRRR